MTDTKPSHSPRGFRKAVNPANDGTLNLGLSLALVDTGVNDGLKDTDIEFWFDLAASLHPDLIAEVKQAVSYAAAAGLLDRASDDLKEHIVAADLPHDVAMYMFTERVNANLKEIGATSALSIENGEIVPSVNTPRALAGRVWLDFYRLGLDNGKVEYARCGYCHIPYRKTHGRSLFCCTSHRIAAHRTDAEK